MKSARGLARLNIRLQLMVSVTPVMHELFPLDSSINKTVYHLLGIFLLMVVYSLSLPSPRSNRSPSHSLFPSCN